MIAQAASLIPRLVDELELPYPLRVRACEVVEDWQRHGSAALLPQTVACCAMLRAHEELRPSLRDVQLDVKGVSAAAGMSESTVLKAMRHEGLPWPTRELSAHCAKLRATHLEAAARRVLDDWLSAADGPAREWARGQFPRDLAALALVRVSRGVAGEAGGGAVTNDADPTLDAIAACIGDKTGRLAKLLGTTPS